MRRIQMLEFKISIAITFLTLFLPAKIESFAGVSKKIEYGYFFRYITIIQDKEGIENSIFSNLFNNQSFSLHILNMFLNIVIFYYIVKFIRDFYFKYKNKKINFNN